MEKNDENTNNNLQHFLQKYQTLFLQKGKYRFNYQKYKDLNLQIYQNTVSLRFYLRDLNFLYIELFILLKISKYQKNISMSMFKIRFKIYLTLKLRKIYQLKFYFCSSNLFFFQL